MGAAATGCVGVGPLGRPRPRRPRHAAHRPDRGLLGRRLLIPLLVVISSLAGSTQVAAQEKGDDVTLGGGSDIRSGTVIAVPAGATIPALHHVAADNPGPTPIDVEFRSEAPPGISIEPTIERTTIPPGGDIRVQFAIRVAAGVVPGDHRVTAQLVRSDVTAEPGRVTNVPAVGTTFTLRTGGESAAISVRSIGAQTGQPVEGTLSVAYLDPPAKPFEVERAEGTTLTAQVAAPGRYEVAYTLDGTRLASDEVSVVPGEDLAVTLAVDSVSFVSASAEPQREGGAIVVADLRASVQNHLGTIAGPLALKVEVHRDGTLLDEVELERLDALDEGVTEAELTYRPDDGFRPGEYRFEFVLASDDFNIRYTKTPSFEVPAPFPWLIAAVVAAALVATAALIRAWRRRRRRDRTRGEPSRGSTASRTPTPPSSEPAAPLGSTVVATPPPVPARSAEPGPVRRSPSPGWYPDPAGRFGERYWDGDDWTEHVRSGGHMTIDPPVA